MLGLSPCGFWGVFEGVPVKDLLCFGFCGDSCQGPSFLRPCLVHGLDDDETTKQEETKYADCYSNAAAWEWAPVCVCEKCCSSWQDSRAELEHDNQEDRYANTEGQNASLRVVFEFAELEFCVS